MNNLSDRLRHIFKININRINNYHGWVGVTQDQKRSVLFNVSTINPIILCRIGWDLGLRSPGGFNSDNACDPEMGFSLYLDDILEHQPDGREQLSTELMKTCSVIEMNDHECAEKLSIEPSH
jgi:hypothetical protein